MIADLLRQIDAKLADARATANEATERLPLARRRLFAELRKRSEAQIEHIRKSLVELVQETNGLNGQLTAVRIDALLAGCDQQIWSTFPVPSSTPSSSCPKIARIGLLRRKMRTIDGESLIEVPAVLPLLGTSNLLILAREEGLIHARRGLTAFLLRLLCTTTPGLLRLRLIDPAHAGDSFMELVGLGKHAVEARIGTESRQALKAEIGAVDEYIAEVKSQYLGALYEDLAAYNRVSGELPLPWQILAIADFPYGWDKDATDVLLHIARNGPRAGVHVAAIVDTSVALPHGINLDGIKRLSVVLQQEHNGFRINSDGFNGFRLKFDALPRPADWLSAVIARLNEAIEKSADVVVPLDGYRPRNLWTESAARGLLTPLGRSAKRQDQDFEVNQQRFVNTIVAGQVGTGKTVLLNTVILGLCWRYSPEELNLYLLDFKEGLGFQVFRRLPHCRVLGLKSEPELGIEVLRALEAEMRKRSRLFKATVGSDGRTVNDIEGYRSATAGKPEAEYLPRLLVVFDEYQELTVAQGGIGDAARQSITRLARLGREVGIHLLFATQTPRGAGIDGPTLAQFATRIVLFLEHADSTTVLSANNAGATTLHRKGEAIYNNQAGDVAGNRRFQVAFIEKDRLPKRVAELAVLASKQGWTERPMVYDGTKRPSPGNAPQVEHRLKEGPEPDMPLRLIGVIGSPVDLRKEHEEVAFVRQPGGHLLVVGKDLFEGDQSESAAGCVIAVCAGMALHAPERTLHFWVANWTSRDLPIHKVPNRLSLLPQECTIGAAELEQWLIALADSIPEREKNESLRRRSEIVVIYGLNRVRFVDLREFKPTEGAKALRRILQDGASVGIHVVAQCDDRASLVRRLENRDIMSFGTRVVVSGGGGRQLFDPKYGPEEIEPEFGWVERDDHLGTIRKFRTYGPQTRAWLEAYFSRKPP